MLIGCIADDLTGATDVAVNFARAGLSVVQVNGVPRAGLQVGATDAVVVALKSRTIAAAEACRLSLAALDWLRAHGAERIYFKVCSTFDSTPAGNIGAVADVLLDALGADFAAVTPAYPRNQRTVYLGHLFVGDLLLSDSSMRHHPLTPMTDANLVRVLQAQTKHRVGLLPYATVEAGVEAARAALAKLRADGFRYAILDATQESHLPTLGAATADLALTVGGSGLAVGLAQHMRGQASGAGAQGSKATRDWARGGARTGAAPEQDAQAPAAAAPPSRHVKRVTGPAAILAGSCSQATLAQIAAVTDELPLLRLDPAALATDAGEVERATAWAKSHLGAKPILITSSVPPEELAQTQQALGRERAATLIEDAFRALARALLKAGVRRFVVAGGETSGAVVESLSAELGFQALAIGAEIAPGVPWTTSLDGEPIALALKSGNFGGPDFFRRAFEVQP